MLYKGDYNIPKICTNQGVGFVHMSTRKLYVKNWLVQRRYNMNYTLEVCMFCSNLCTKVLVMCPSCVALGVNVHSLLSDAASST